VGQWAGLWAWLGAWPGVNIWGHPRLGAESGWNEEPTPNFGVMGCVGPAAGRRTYIHTYTHTLSSLYRRLLYVLQIYISWSRELVCWILWSANILFNVLWYVSSKNLGNTGLIEMHQSRRDQF
jgi:hypothetical protein